MTVNPANLTKYKVQILSELSQTVTLTDSFIDETIQDDHLIKANAILEILQEKINSKDKYIASQNDMILNLSTLHMLSNLQTLNVEANETSSKCSNEQVCHDKQQSKPSRIDRSIDSENAYETFLPRKVETISTESFDTCESTSSATFQVFSEVNNRVSQVRYKKYHNKLCGYYTATHTDRTIFSSDLSSIMLIEDMNNFKGLVLNHRLPRALPHADFKRRPQHANYDIQSLPRE